MIQHIIQLIWNKKKQNALLMVEVFVSFLVLFAVFSLLFYRYQNFKKPLGFNADNVWRITLHKAEQAHLSTTAGTPKPDSSGINHSLAEQTLKEIPGVKAYSFSGFNTPFVMMESSSRFTINNQRIETNVYSTDDHYASVLGLQLLEGRWLSPADQGLKNVVINRSFRDQVFGNKPALGQKFAEFKVVGIIEDIKDKGDYERPENGMYMRF